MRAVGIILAGGNSFRMKELSNKRAIAAMPIAGSFRSIDFALSSMSNSSIQRVAVLTQYNSRSLNQHLSSSKWWDFGRKQGGLFVFPPMVTSDNDFWYRGTADAIHQNLDFLKQCHEPYVVIASGDCIYKLDYAKVLEYHGGVSYHGKSAVIDDRLAIVGSFNMDMKSAYQDTELMLVIDSRPLCEILKKSFTSYQEEADAADGTVDSKEELFDDTTGVLKKVSNYVISKLNPYLRYLF